MIIEEKCRKIYKKENTLLFIGRLAGWLAGWLAG